MTTLKVKTGVWDGEAEPGGVSGSDTGYYLQSDDLAQPPQESLTVWPEDQFLHDWTLAIDRTKTVRIQKITCQLAAVNGGQTIVLDEVVFLKIRQLLIRAFSGHRQPKTTLNCIRSGLQAGFLIRNGCKT
jgi:hypothetical protein